MSTRLHYVLPLAAALVLAGCVTVPTGPAVMALPGTAKSFDDFRADYVSCRQYAQYQLGPAPGQPGADAVAANAAGGTARQQRPSVKSLDHSRAGQDGAQLGRGRVLCRALAKRRARRNSNS